MGIFSRKPAAHVQVPTWKPTVDLAAARPIIFALANVQGAGEFGIEGAISDFVRLSERPSTAELIRLSANASSPDDRNSTVEQLLNRPWIYLAAVMRQASAADDHHLVLAGLFWACHWTYRLLPQNNSVGALEELGLCPIANSLKAEIMSLGIDSANKLPEDFVVAGDQTQELLAGPLALAAPELLGLR